MMPSRCCSSPTPLAALESRQSPTPAARRPAGTAQTPPGRTATRWALSGQTPAPRTPASQPPHHCTRAVLLDESDKCEPNPGSGAGSATDVLDCTVNHVATCSPEEHDPVHATSVHTANLAVFCGRSAWRLHHCAGSAPEYRAHDRPDRPPPKIVQLAPDTHEHLVQVPFVVGPPPAAFQPFGKQPAEAPSPFSYGFVAHHNAACREDQFNLSQAQAEAVIQPHGVLDDLGAKAEATIGVNGGGVIASSLPYAAPRANLTAPEPRLSSPIAI